jgi:hypothetical protein
MQFISSERLEYIQLDWTDQHPLDVAMWQLAIGSRPKSQSHVRVHYVGMTDSKLKLNSLSISWRIYALEENNERFICIYH